MNRVAFRVKWRALALTRQETAAPHTRRHWLRVSSTDARKHNKARQILALAPQSIGHPRTHARPAGKRRAGVHHGVGGVVINLVGVHRTDDANLVSDRLRMR